MPDTTGGEQPRSNPVMSRDMPDTGGEAPQRCQHVVTLWLHSNHGVASTW